MTERTRTFAKEVIKSLHFDNGDIILLQAKPGTGKGEAIRRFEALRRALARTGNERCIVIVVDDINELRVLGVKEMAEYGWQPLEQDR